MSKPVKEWSKGSVSIAVEAGKDDANKEPVHVHVYKRGRRTKAYISQVKYSDEGIDASDFDEAFELFNRNISEIKRYYEKVKSGEFDR